MGPSKCRPNTRRSKLEKPDVDGPKWWNKYLSKIEAEICKPSITRPEDVFSVISKRQTFKVVSEILGLDEAKCDHLCIKEAERERQAKYERDRQALEARLREENRSLKTKSRGSTALSLVDRIAIYGDDDDDDESESLDNIDGSTTSSSREEEEVYFAVDSISDTAVRTSIDLQGSSQQEFEEQYDAYSNPYLRFLRRPPERAASWRPRPEPTPTGAYQADPNMTLLEKSEAITSKIASDFCTWMRILSGDQNLEIDEKTLIELFRLEFDKPASRGVANRMREMPTLTPLMSKSLEIPELDFWQYLRDQICLDVAAESATPRLIAFGTRNDETSRVDPPQNDTKAQWIRCKLPPDLASFATAFSGIENIESYVGYCKHLKRNPHLRRPPCMEEWGIFDQATNVTSAVPSGTVLEVDLDTAVSFMNDAAAASGSSLMNTDIAASQSVTEQVRH